MDPNKRVKILEKERKAQDKFNKKYYREDEPQKERKKRAFFVFFELVFENLWQFFMLNLFYGIVFVPIILLGIEINLKFTENIENAQDLSAVPYLLGIVLLLGVLLGPVTAASTYIFRNLKTGKHISFFPDFFKQFASNFRQSFMFGVFDAIVVASVLSLLWLFGAIMTVGADLKTAALLCLIAFVLFLYYSMRPYLYLQIVTVNLKVNQIVRNALFFALLGVKSNILSLLIFAVFVGMGVLVAWTPWMLLFWSICGFSVAGFAQVSCVYKVFHQHLIAPEEERAEKEAELDSKYESDGPSDIEEPER